VTETEENNTPWNRRGGKREGTRSRVKKKGWWKGEKGRENGEGGKRDELNQILSRRTGRGGGGASTSGKKKN